MSAERERVETFGQLENGLRQAGDWYHWGPYLSERQWGTVREDYSPGGTAWEYLPHDHARSRAYRWGEDGLAGFSDVEQRLCLALALWNGRDPILKERIFGLTGNEGNHGEDAKEYWWYLDALPSHAWNRWRYHYPQREFPYGDLVAENARRGKLDPEYELLDTGAFDDDRYWIVEVDYAKADPHDLLMTVRVTNAGPEADTLHVLPTAWYRNTWAWDDRRRASPSCGSSGDGAGRHRASVPRPARARRRGRRRRCSSARTRRTPSGCSAPRRRRATPKDGINDHVVAGARRPSPTDAGTKAAFWYRLDVAAGRRPRRVRVRLRPTGSRRRPVDATSTTSRPTRLAEADEFYAELTPAEATRGRGARAAPGARRDALEQAALLLRRRALARRRPDAADAARRRGSAAATRAGGRSTPSTSCRCRTSGSTRGSRPGISPSTASRSRTSTRRSPSTS